MDLIFLPDYLSRPWIREKYKWYVNLEDGDCGYYVTKEDYELNWKEKSQEKIIVFS